MVKEEEISFAVDNVTAQMFSDLFRDSETIRAHHIMLNKNPNIRVGEWLEGTRRVAFLTTYQAPAWVKKLIRFEVIKVVEMQRLREVRDAAGQAVVDMTMTSEPAIFVPFWGSNVKMGEVVFRVRSAPGAPGCMVNTHLTCSADQFKFLWGIKGHVERIMLQESKRVALSYVDFATKLATCAPGLEAVWDASRKKAIVPGLDLKGVAAAADEASAPSSRREGEVTQRGASTTSSSSGASVYFDASEELSSTLGDSDAGQEAHLLLQAGGRHDHTIDALQNMLCSVREDVRALREHSYAAGEQQQWQSFLNGAALGASTGCLVTACMLYWRARRQ